MNFVYVISVIWISAMIGTIFTGDTDSFVCALLATIAIGIGYLIIRV